MSVGIDEISFYTSSYYLDLRTLAEERQTDHEKYYSGIGQEQMSIAAPDEDVVTLAANAARPIVESVGHDQIDTLLFATETGIDQSKSAGVYVHRLLNMHANCRVVELKQACYSATAALQMACALVHMKPSSKVLVIASDIARYDLNTPGEATQGCGAVAMLITRAPKIISIFPEVGNYTDDVMDFWRPNYRNTALVDGKYSTKVYLRALKYSWEHFVRSSALRFSDFSKFCYHLPFSRMAQKGHQHLARINKSNLTQDELENHINDTLRYNKVTGNSYTASLYIGLCSLLDYCETDLSNQHIGFFSYGSGCVAEYFAGQVSPGYQSVLRTQRHKQMLEQRSPLSYEEYLSLYHFADPQQGENIVFPKTTRGDYRLAAINHHKREYVAC